jgi:imidazolonepropionase-like amidohydrolase
MDMHEEHATAHGVATQKHTSVRAIVGGTIIDGRGGSPIKDGVILIDGQRIKAVGDRSMPIPMHAGLIQVTGKYIMPGLIYPKAIMVNSAAVPDLIRLEGRYDEVFIEAAQLALKCGVTTIFDYYGPRDPLIKARNAINEGRAIGARIYLCGNWIGCGGLFSPDILDHGKEEVGEHSFDTKLKSGLAIADAAFRARTNAQWEVNIGEALIPMSLEAVREEVRQYVESGIDYVTYLVNCHRLPAYSYIAFSPRVQRMIVEEAHRAGLPVQAHFATTEEGVHLALDAGADIVSAYPYGGRPMSAETLALVAQGDVFLNIEPHSSEETEWYRRQPPSALYPGLLKQVETAECDHLGLVRAGARVIGAGTNTMLSTGLRALLSSATAARPVPEMGEGHVSGIQALQDKGMSPMEALMAATQNVARAFKVDRDLGTVEPGKLADLIVLDKNPLESPQNYRGICLVLKEGQVVDRDFLPTQRLWTAPLAQSN